MKIANTSVERSASLVLILKLSNKLQLHWRLPNSAKIRSEIWPKPNLGKWPNFEFAEAEIRCNPSLKMYIPNNVQLNLHTPSGKLMYSSNYVKLWNCLAIPTNTKESFTWWSAEYDDCAIGQRNKNSAFNVSKTTATKSRLYTDWNTFKSYLCSNSNIYLATALELGEYKTG